MLAIAFGAGLRSIAAGKLKIMMMASKKLGENLK